MDLLTQSVTADNFLEVAHLPEFADRNIELVEGELYEMPVTTSEHSEIESRLSILIGHYVLQHQLGRTYSGNAGVIVDRDDSGDTIRGLDFVFLRTEKAPRRLPRGLIDITPDLAIEVMSPSNTVSDTNLKIDQLLRVGCPEVWIVHPDLRRVDVHSLDGIRVYREGDIIGGGDILPGFELAVADIFPR